MSDTTDVFFKLAQAVHDAGESGNFTIAESARLTHAHTALNAAIRTFTARPGPEPKQEQAEAEAEKALAALDAASSGQLEPALTAIQEATRALIAATAPATAAVTDADLEARPPARAGAAIPALQGSLRIAPRAQPAARRAGAAGAGEGAGPAGGGDPTAYNKLITLFPAEALTLYGVGLAIFAVGDGAKFGVLLVCLVVLVFVRWVANTSRPQADGLTNTDRPAVTVAVIAFLLWATATDPDWLFAPGSLFGIPDDAAARTTAQQWAAFIGAAFVAAASALYTPKPIPE